MKDLDFDELDKAISSVLTTEEPVETALAAPVVVPEQSAGVVVDSAVPTASPTTVTPQPSSISLPTEPIATPSVGGIIRPRTSVDRPSPIVNSGPVRPTAMDIVAPPSQGASRSGITLQPVASAPASEPKSSPVMITKNNDVKLIEADYDDDDVAIKNDQQDTAVSSDGWPSITPKTAVQPVVSDEESFVEPEKISETTDSKAAINEPSAATSQGIDHMFGSFGEVIETSSSEEVKADETTDDAKTSEVVSIQDSDAISTPFLSGTKVEKRPLGATAVSTETEQVPQGDAMPKIEEPKIDLNEKAHEALSEHTAHIVGSTAVKKNGKGLLIGSIIFLVLVIIGVAAVFLFGDQLGL